MANWTPNDIATELWFDADDASTITESNGVVSQWNDKSPNAAHAAAAIVGDRPTTNAQTLNGKNVIAFNEHVLQASTAFLNGKTSLGAIVVFDNQNSAIQDRGIFSTKTDRADNGFGVRTDSAGYVGGGTNVYKICCSTTDSFNNCELSNQSATLDPVIIAMRWDAGIGMRARIDGTINTFTSDTATNIGTTTDMASFFIGQGAGTGRAIGNYAELIVFDGLSDEDVERLEGYVAHKWGLTANLPGNHKYKTEAPQSGGGSTAPTPPTLEHDFEIFLNFEDTTEREKDITVNNAAVTNHLVTYTDNALGNNVADFVGSNAYLDFSAVAARFAALDQVAVSIDFRPNVATGIQVVCGWSDSTVGSTDLLLFIQNGDLNLQLRVNNAQRWKYTVSGGMVAGTNYNVCFSCGSEGPKLWINGVVQDPATHMVAGTAASTESLSHFSPDTCRVGANKDSGGDEFFFDGHVKDFVVANAQFDQNTVDDIQAGFYGYELLALWGQSNAVGRATLRGGTDDNYTKVSGLVDQYGYSGQAITAATNPLDHVNEQSNDMGLWLSLCNELVDILPYKRRILLAPMAQGGTGFQTNHWNAGNTLYEAALSRTNAALAQNRLSRVAMMHWLQGETDADNGNTTYLNDLTAMQSDAYTRLNGFDASTPFVCVSILGSSIPANVSVINTDLQAFADGAANRHYVDATDLNLFDAFHYDAASLDAIGLRSFNAVYGTQSGGSTATGSLALQWNALQAIFNSTRIDFDMLQGVLSSTQFDWTILNGAENSSSWEWDLFGATVGTLGIDWDLLQQSSAALNLDWNVLQNSVSALELQFNILEQAQITLGIYFNILAPVNRSFEIVFDNDGAANKVNSSFALSWTVQGIVERALAAEWSVLESVGVSLDLVSDIAEAVANEVELQSSILEAATGQTSISWDSIQVSTGAVSLRWSVSVDDYIQPIHTMIVLAENRVMIVKDD